MRLFRAISPAERLALNVFGILTAGPSSCEGKHFATTLEHARAWGQKLPIEGFIVLEVEIEAVDVLYFISENLDMIGPAYFLDEKHFDMCKIVTIHE